MKADTFDESLRLLTFLWRLDHALGKKSRSMLGSLGVTAEQRMVLRVIGRQPGILAGEIATALHLDRGTISATLGRLEHGGLVTRGADPGDARRVKVKLTRKGEKLDVPTPGTVESCVAEVLSSAPAEDVDAFQRVLEALITRLEQESG